MGLQKASASALRNLPFILENLSHSMSVILVVVKGPFKKDFKSVFGRGLNCSVYASLSSCMMLLVDNDNCNPDFCKVSRSKEV